MRRFTFKALIVCMAMTVALPAAQAARTHKDADGGKAQIPAGPPDGFLQRRIVQHGVPILHSPDVTAVFQLPDEAATQRLGQVDDGSLGRAIGEHWARSKRKH